MANLQQSFDLRLAQGLKSGRITATEGSKVRQVQNNVHERIMNLRCPRCRQVFDDFDGCCALQCSRVGCGCYFCAYCMRDCGTKEAGWTASHKHVSRCRYNTEPNKNVFADKSIFIEAQRLRRSRMLDKYLGKIPVTIRNLYLASEADELKALGIEHSFGK